MKTLRLDESPSPTVDQMIEFLRGYWLPDESILYVGKATSLRARTGQMFRHRLGERRPHAGGHWLKTLSCLDDLTLFFAPCESVGTAESKEQDALKAFTAQVSHATRGVLANPSVPIPFANREYPPGTRKQRRLAADVLY